jgi:predicted transcriptional regulator
VARPPLEHYAEALSQQEMESIVAQLPGKVEIIVDFSQEAKKYTRKANTSEILHILQRRPCTALDICKALNLDKNSTTQALDQLEHSGSISRKEHQGKEYYQVTMPCEPMANECNI